MQKEKPDPSANPSRELNRAKNICTLALNSFLFMIWQHPCEIAGLMAQKCKHAEAMEHSWAACLAAAFPGPALHGDGWVPPKSLGIWSYVAKELLLLGPNAFKLPKTIRNVCVLLSCRR